MARKWLCWEAFERNQTWFANSESTSESEKATIKDRQLKMRAAVLVQLR